MPNIVATAGASTANSFASQSEADAYLDARLNASAWNDEDDDDQKVRALIEATRQLNVMPWVGTRSTDTQSLSWPRTDAPNPDAASIETVTYDGSIVPTRIKNATIELALEFLRAGTTDVASADTTIGIQEKTVGPLTTVYFEPYLRPQGLAKYPRVLGLIAPLLDAAQTGGLTMVRC